MTLCWPAQGLGFWEWFAAGQYGPASEGGGQGLYGIYESDDTFKYSPPKSVMLQQCREPPPVWHAPGPKREECMADSTTAVCHLQRSR